MKLVVPELLLEPKEGFYTLMVAWGSEGETGEDTVIFDNGSKFGDPSNVFGDGQ